MRWWCRATRRKMRPSAAAVTRPSPPRRQRRAPLARLAAGLLALVASALAADDDASLKQVRDALAATRDALARDAGRLGAAREQAFALERDIAASAEAQAALAARIERKRERIAALRQERKTLEAGLQRSRALLGRNAVARYALATQPRLKLLLNQDEAASLSRRLAYYDYVMSAYDRDLDAGRARLRELADTEAALKLESNRLRRLRHENDSELRRLRVMREEHRSLVAAIETRMAEGNNRLQQLSEDERRVLELVERLAPAAAAAAPASRPFATLKGALTWPADGRVAKAPGTAMRAGGARWAGVLIDSPAGDEVRAVAAGEVVYADWFRNLGKLVIVDHGDGYMTLYGNNAEVRTQAGERVAAGDTIATVGAGGGEMPAGLYFELRERGQPLDPRQWCARR